MSIFPLSKEETVFSQRLLHGSFPAALLFSFGCAGEDPKPYRSDDDSALHPISRS